MITTNFNNSSAICVVSNVVKHATSRAPYSKEPNQSIQFQFIHILHPSRVYHLNNQLNSGLMTPEPATDYAKEP